MTPETATTTTRKPRVKSAATKTAVPAKKATTAAAAPKAKRTMSDDHKTALAQGRNEGRAVTNYLNALESNRPKRGRKRTPESIARRLEAIDQRLLDAEPINRLQLIQERLDLQAEAQRLQDRNDLTELEAAFIQVAKSYGERKGITSAAWRSLQVPKSVLRQAGV